MWSWGDRKSADEFAQLMDKEGINIASHSGTYFHEDENALTEINVVVAICDTLKKNKLLENSEDISNILEHIEETDFSLYVRNLCEISQFGNGEYPEAIKGNHRHLDIFFSKMEEKGFIISDTYKKVFREIDKIGMANISEANIDSIFQEIGSDLEDEKIILNDFLNSITAVNKGDMSYVVDKYMQPISKFMTTIVLDSIARSKERTITNELKSEQNDDLSR